MGLDMLQITRFIGATLLPLLSSLLYLPAYSATQEVCEAALPRRVSGSITLPEGCTYTRGVVIQAPDTTLDCNGAVFDGQGRSSTGLLIDSQGNPMSNIAVRRCTFKNFSGNGVRVAWRDADNQKGSDREKIYKRTPQGVTLDTLRVENSGKVGIFLDDYVSESVITHSVVQNSAGVGLYLEHSSRANRIVDNRFVHNGHSAAKREALAIDSSANNVIENNVFETNYAGGIFLYKNCGEHEDSGKSVTRWQPSNGNLIRHNRFIDEPVGVWIASRQSRNLEKTRCSDPSMDATGRYFQDYADDNTIESNTFCGQGVSVRVEGDRNRIVSNQSEPRGGTKVEFPTTQRERLLKRPQTGNIVSGNSSAACSR